MRKRGEGKKPQGRKEREQVHRKVRRQRSWWLPSTGKKGESGREVRERGRKKREKKKLVDWFIWQGINGQFKTFPELMICPNLFKFLI